MNMTLPRLDGLDARAGCAPYALHDVPIVFLSGHVQPSMRALALDTGGTEYLINRLISASWIAFSKTSWK